MLPECRQNTTKRLQPAHCRLAILASFHLYQLSLFILRLRASRTVTITFAKFIYTAYQNAPHFNILPVVKVSRKGKELYYWVRKLN